jgi:hypothetical protein
MVDLFPNGTVDISVSPIPTGFDLGSKQLELSTSPPFGKSEEITII